MNTESLRNDVLVPAVAKTLDIAAKVKPTKDELCTTAKITAAVAVATAWRYKQYCAIDKRSIKKTTWHCLSFSFTFTLLFP